MAYKGFYKPLNCSKYIGNPTNIMYRSLWERKFMRFCDSATSVIRWGFEQVVIPYTSPLDRNPHKYYVDFIVEVAQPNGTVKTLLIEIKPKKQCAQPTKPKKISKTYAESVKTWLINSAKWNAARNAATSRNWEFKILTEEDLFRKK